MKSDQLDDRERLSVLQAIVDNQSLIIPEAISALSENPEKSLQKSTKLYINHNFASFCKDMQLILKHINYMMFQGYPKLQYQSLDSLKSEYINQGVSVIEVIRVIDLLKEATLDVLATDERLINLLSDSDSVLVKSENIETISEIKKRYSYMWVAVEVTELEKGCPKAGKVILVSMNRDKISEEISKRYCDMTNYTFYCGGPEEEANPVKVRIKMRVNKYLEPYFDFVIRELGEDN